MTSLQSKLNSAWINLDTTSIFEFFPYNDRTGIWTLFNGADLPSEVTEHSSTPWYMVLKAHERMILFHDTGFYFTGASGKVWNKVWIKM